MKSLQHICIRILIAVMLIPSPFISAAGGSAFAASRNDVVVSAFMADPAIVSDGAGEWVRLFNRTADDVDLGGWVLTDEDRGSHTFSSLLLPALGSVTLCRNGDSRLNGGVACDYVYGNDFQIKNEMGSVVILDSHEKEVNRVMYTSYWVRPGKVTELSDPDSDNGTFRNWVFAEPEKPIVASAVILAEAVPAAAITKGAAENTGSVLITEFMADPTDTGDESGEWIELYNATNHTIDLNGWTLSDEDSEQHVISVADGEFAVASGQYVTLCRDKNFMTNGSVACNYGYGDEVQLKNEGGKIVLRDTHDNVISAVTYTAAWVRPGQSTALLLLDADAATMGNLASWKYEESTAVDASGRDMGTPGRRNSPQEPIEVDVREVLAGDFPALPKNVYPLGSSGFRIDEDEAFGESTEVTAPVDTTIRNYVVSGQPVTVLGWDSRNQMWETVGNQDNLKNGWMRVYLAHGTTLAFVSTDVLAPYLFEVAQKPIVEPVVEPIEEPVAEEAPVVTPPAEVPVVETVKKIFTDVSPIFWAYDYIKALEEAGVIHGYPDGTFRPHRFVNRAEMAKVALKAFNLKPHVGMVAHYRDVSPQSWFGPFVEKARLLGVILAEKGYYHPDRPATRAEALAMVLRASLLKPEALTFDTAAKDVLPGDWFYGYVRFAEDKGIIDIQRHFYPDKPASRADVAAMTARAMEAAKKAKKSEFFSSFEEMKMAAIGS